MTIIGILAVLAVIFGMRSLFVLDEAEQAIIVRFGEPLGDVIVEPGLHWKLPRQNVGRNSEAYCAACTQHPAHYGLRPNAPYGAWRVKRPQNVGRNKRSALRRMCITFGALRLRPWRPT